MSKQRYRGYQLNIKFSPERKIRLKFYLSLPYYHAYYYIVLYYLKEEYNIKAYSNSSDCVGLIAGKFIEGIHIIYNVIIIIFSCGVGNVFRETLSRIHIKLEQEGKANEREHTNSVCV